MATSADDPPTVTLKPTTKAIAHSDVPDELDAGRYRVTGEIGRGGMGVVVRAHDRRMDRDVAVKLVGGDAPDDYTRTRFLAEARLQGQLQHPSIVPVYDAGRSADGRELLVMREIEGTTLRAVLARAGGPGQPGRGRLLAAFSQVCLAIDYCHARGVIHRDLKPENIMLGEFGEVYVLDWGLAGPPDALAGRQGGTKGYAAPEQMVGAASPRSDVFSLGVILLEILKVPPDGGAFGDRDVPELVWLGQQASDPDPRRRPISSRELATAIDRYLDGERDVALRRRLADEAIRAATAAGTSGDPVARRTALRESGRAIALEPNHAEARALLRELLATPPDVRELGGRWAGYTSVAIRGAATSAAFGFVGLFAMVPVEVWMGVRMPGWFAARLALGAIAITLCLGLGRWWRPTAVATWAAFLAGCGVIGMSSLVVGPFVMVPTMAALIAASLALLNGRRLLAATSIAAIALIAVPIVLEVTGILPPSMRFTDGNFVILPRLVELPAGPTLAYVAVKEVTILIVIGAMLGRFRDELAIAERKLRVHAWQLEQLAE